jgi:hypothetical protein
MPLKGEVLSRVIEDISLRQRINHIGKRAHLLSFDNKRKAAIERCYSLR